MPDFDLAEMYGIKTKVLKQAMRRNMKRFWGEDFCFEFTKKELSRSHKVHDFSVLRSLILCPNLFKNSFSFIIFNVTLQGNSTLSSSPGAAKDAAALKLDLLEQKWRGKYPYAIRSWLTNWDDLTSFFDFSIWMRKIIYTTNLIENLNGKIRKYTKNKLSFSNDDILKKSVYLLIMEIEKKWSQSIWNWGMIFNQFLTIFEDRIQV